MKFRKKVLVAMLSAAVLVSGTALPCFAEEATQTSSSLQKVGNVYQISSAADLAFMRDRVNAKDKNYAAASYLLTADIDLSGYQSYYTDENYGSYTFNGDTKHGVGWKSIGFREYDNPCPFQGTFDGGNHTVTGLVMDNAAADGFGLFGYVEGVSKSSRATIKNLIIDSCNVKGFSDIGGVVGVAYNTNISNCSVTGTSVLSALEVGGVVGVCWNSTVTNCHVTGGTVTGLGGVTGGVAGGCPGGDVTNCYATCAVTGVDGEVGGVVGDSSDGNVTNCYSTGAVTETESGSHGITTYGAGGVVGSSENINIQGRVSNCYFTGTVTGASIVGGIVGEIYRNNISNCYSTGTVTGTGGQAKCFAGGVVGDAEGGNITNCYSACTVTAAAASEKTEPDPKDFHDAYVNAAGGIVGVGRIVEQHLVTESSTPYIFKITHCVALNPSVTGVLRAGRVVGIGGSASKFDALYACSSMTLKNGGAPVALNAKTKGTTTKNGLDVATETINYTKRLADCWDSTWNPNIWNLTAGKLPTLKI